MTRSLYDSTNIYDIPASALMVGYYVDGLYAVSETTVRARFPNAILVGISAIGTDAGIVGDVEPGCMDPTYAVQWVQWRRAAGFDPTIYCNQLHGWNPVRVAFQKAGVPPPHYWVANYDGVASIPAGAVAKQYANPTLTGGHYDLSVVADTWPGVDGLFGPGEGTIGGDDMTADQIKQMFDDLARLMSDLTSVKINVTDLYFALGLPQPNPTDPTTAKSKVLTDLQASVDALKPSGGGGTQPEPTIVTLDIPAQQITGKLT